METKYNDYELLYLIRQKNEIAFAILMRKYERVARYLIQKYVGEGLSLLLKEDYLQNGRLKLLQAVEDYREDSNSSFYHFYCEIYHNLLIDCYRKSQRRNYAISLDEPLYGSDNQYCLLDIMESSTEYISVSPESLERIQKRKANLNSMEKKIVDLRAVGYTYQQIADLLKINIKKVDNTLQKVRSDKQKIKLN